MTEQRELREITLPVSGKKVDIITYYERGERVQIENIMYEDAKMRATGGEPDVEFSVANTAKQRDKALEIAVRTIDGQKATMQMINKLRNKDAMYLEKEVANIDKDDEEEKKS